MKKWLLCLCLLMCSCGKKEPPKHSFYIGTIVVERITGIKMTVEHYSENGVYCRYWVNGKGFERDWFGYQDVSLAPKGAEAENGTIH